MRMRYSSPPDAGPRTASDPRRRRKAGNVMVMFTMLLPFVLVPLVGIAIDATMLYSVKAKLQAAVDGGALAAAQSLSAGLTITDQAAAAQLVADEFIKANIVTGATAGSGGYWGAFALNDTNCDSSQNPIYPMPASPPSPNNCLYVNQSSSTKQRTISIGASVQVPLLFMRILGFSTGTVTSKGQASRRDVVLVLLIDRSGSMGAELQAVQAGSTYFVNQFAPGRDMLGLVLIAGSAMVAYPTTDWGLAKLPLPGNGGPDVHFRDPDGNNPPSSPAANPNMLTSISNIVSGSNTGTAEGLMLAWKELQAANQPGALNVIVLWTDGAPNGITADFNNKVTNSVLATSTCANTKAKGAANLSATGQYPEVQTNSMLGWFAQWGGYVWNSNATNGIRERMQTATGAGLSVTYWVKLSAGNEPVIAPNTVGGQNGAGPGKGCYFEYVNNGSTVPENVGAIATTYGGSPAAGSATDISIPSVDWFGNSTQGSTVLPYTQTDFTQSNLWTSAGANCQAGKNGQKANQALQLTGLLTGANQQAAANACQVGLASWNAADMAGQQIHGDTTLLPVIYTLGYAGEVSGNGGVDTVLLSRLANVNTSQDTVYNPSIPQGQFILVQTVDDVQPAFEAILAEILRLSQ